MNDGDCLLIKLSIYAVHYNNEFDRVSLKNVGFF